MDILAFRLHLLSLGLAEHTVNNTIWTVKNLPHPLTPESFQDYLVKLLGKCKPNYVKRVIADARRFGDYKKLEWLSKFKQITTKYKPQRVLLTDEQIEYVLSIEEPKNVALRASWWVFTVVLAVMAYTGCRPGEAAGLETQDVDLARKSITFRNTKTGDTRVIPIVEPLLVVLSPYIHLAQLSDCRVLFPKRGKNEAITPKLLSIHFNRRLELARIPKRDGLTPYSFRHSFCTRMLSTGGGNASLYDVQAIVGHKSAETTQIYAHPDLDSLHQAIRRLPLAKKHLKPAEKKQSFKEMVLELERQGFCTIKKQEDDGSKLKLEVDFKKEPDK